MMLVTIDCKIAGGPGMNDISTVCDMVSFVIYRVRVSGDTGVEGLLCQAFHISRYDVRLKRA